MMLSFFSRLKVWLLLLLLGFFTSSCVSRLAQPALSGYLFNYDNEAVVGARVNDTYTNEEGYFSIDEQRYLRLLPVEIIQLEAPPVFYEIAIEQAGYEPIHEKFFQQHGGTQRKGTKHYLDTIYLKRIEEPIDLSTLLYQKWNFHANSNLDTLYGYNSNYRLGRVTADRPLMPNWKLSLSIEKTFLPIRFGLYNPIACERYILLILNEMVLIKDN